MSIFGKFLRTTVAGPLFAFLVVVVIVSMASDRFLMGANLSNVSLQVSIVAIVAIGATLVILTGGIDLSPGSTVALVCCTLAILVKNLGLPLPLGILLVLILGVVLGFVNGFLSTYGRIPSFIVTLATMSIYRGLAFLITSGTPIFSVSPELDAIFYGKLLGIPLPFYYVLVLYIITAVFLRNTIPGRSIYALGGNESAARLTGIRVNRVRLLAYVLAGLMAAIAGVLQTAWLNSGSPNYGGELGLESIAAAVIGGASLAGGYGSIMASLVGALTVAVVQNGLNLRAVPASWQEITIGGVIVLAVGIDMWRSTLGGGVNRFFHIFSPKKKDMNTGKSLGGG
ncbi:MAG: ABC transporter permease [Anaerolineaceae bacterium]